MNTGDALPRLQRQQQQQTPPPTAQEITTIIPVNVAAEKHRQATSHIRDITDAECDESRSSKLGMTTEQWRILRRIRLISYRGLQISTSTIRDMQMAQRGEGRKDIVAHLARRGLVSWSETGNRGPPKITVVGRGYMLAHHTGLTFFDVCVLAVIYRYARVFSAARRDKSDRNESTIATTSEVSVPVPTIQNYLIDWPGERLKIYKSISNLRTAGLLPRPRRRRKSIVCNMEYLQGIDSELVELGEWVEQTTQRIRNLLVYGKEVPGNDYDVQQPEVDKVTPDGSNGSPSVESAVTSPLSSFEIPDGAPLVPHGRLITRSGESHRRESLAERRQKKKESAGGDGEQVRVQQQQQQQQQQSEVSTS